MNQKRGASQSVRTLTHPRPAKTAGRIDVLFGTQTPGGRRNVALDEGRDFPSQIRCGLRQINFFPTFMLLTNELVYILERFSVFVEVFELLLLFFRAAYFND